MPKFRTDRNNFAGNFEFGTVGEGKLVLHVWLNERETYEGLFFTAGKLVQQEDRAEGAVTLETYKTYMKSAGGA